MLFCRRMVVVKNPHQSAAPKERTYKATKAELAAMLKGKAAFARGGFLTLAEFLDEMDRKRRRPGAKLVAKFPARDQPGIEAAISAMADEPFGGDYRVLFTVYASRSILVTAIVRRTSTTY